MPSGGESAGQPARQFRVGGVPPLAEGFTGRPDTAPGIVEALAPGLAVVLVPGSAFAESPQNRLGACGKTQLAARLAESLWQSGAINALIWIAATGRAAVLPAYAQAYTAGTGPRTGQRQPNQSRRALSAGWAPRGSRGSWCSTTCRTRRTWTACGRRAGEGQLLWSPAGSPRSSPVGPGCWSSRWSTLASVRR